MSPEPAIVVTLLLHAFRQVSDDERTVAALQFILEQTDKSAAAQDTNGITAAHLAAKYNNLTALKWLLQHGGSLQTPDSQGRTPTHWVLDNNLVADSICRGDGRKIAELRQLAASIAQDPSLKSSHGCRDAYDFNESDLQVTTQCITVYDPEFVRFGSRY